MTRSRTFLVPICLLGLLVAGWSGANRRRWLRSSPNRCPERSNLPGEFLPFLSVSLHAKVAGYVDRVLVDRGSIVKQGDLLVELSAPEMTAQIAEAQSKVQAAEADRLQAEAQLAAAQSTYDRTKNGG